MCSSCDGNEYREVIAENVRAAQVPVSAGDGEYTATEAELETLPPTPDSEAA